MNRVTDRVIFSQDKYCGGYSGEDPPLPIPNREVQLTIADGTAPPGGRVGSCHALTRSFETIVSELFCVIDSQLTVMLPAVFPLVRSLVCSLVRSLVRHSNPPAA